LTPAYPPRATYRLQVTADFPLPAAAELVPYLASLGVSHLYSSPLLRARAGSGHGYDVVDPTRIDDGRGGDAGFAALSQALAGAGLGLLLDIVPNHMAATEENPWWRELLERGRGAGHAACFDIDWDSPELGGKLLLPVLGVPYGEALAAGELRVTLDAEGLAVRYFDHRFPLAVEGYPEIAEALAGASAGLREALGSVVEDAEALRRLLPEIAASRPDLLAEASAALDSCFNQSDEPQASSDVAGETGVGAWLPGNEGGDAARDRLDALLAEQHWRLAFWRLAGERVNYRRFFDVNDLVGVCAELPEVLGPTHQLVLDLVRDGRVHGLRIDHIDGLRHPRRYLRHLREQLQALGPGRDYVVVEKILSGDEALPEDWACHGTTGYDFLNSVTGLFVEPAGLAALDQAYAQRTGTAGPFGDLRHDRKRQVMAELFGADLERLTRHLGRLAAAHRTARDLPWSRLHTALVEVTAALPVYRTYVSEDGPGATDERWLATAFAEARRRTADDPLMPWALGFLDEVLHLRPPGYLAGERDRWLGFVRRWQQSTGAVMAKGLEDTALYVHARLLSLNAVGGEPPGVDPPGNAGAFHARNEERRRRWPHALNATTTHDSKRSEDVNARLNVLSEMPAEWEKRLLLWSGLNAGRRRTLADGRVAPDANEEVFLYQTLVGAWPLGEEEQAAFGERVAAYLTKALREAKTHSSWLTPDEAYEEAVRSFATELLGLPADDPFQASFRELAERVAAHGAWGSLAQVVLKVASPGVPDFYQGTELWDLSLVDPDNRRAVDFARRREMLARLQERHAAGDVPELLSELLAGWHDGAVKLYTTWRALAVRAEHPTVFAEGDYLPLAGEGDRARHVVAFARRQGGHWVVAVVPRWIAGAVGAGQAPVGAGLWGDTWITLPADAPLRWRDGMSGAEVASEGARLRLGDALAAFPVALLTGGG
jgi:(1->4)-alpha-D-glucan 1-alpha-D-glucosylmutase